MATIPIEVIIQDVESPVTPTPESGEETNITVPDTGTINSDGDTSSSASSVILPAILLALAIGSIVAILIHKYHKQKNNKTTRKEKLAVATSSTVAILAVTVLIGNLVIPATKAATGDATDGITPAEDKISIVVTRDGGVAEASIESKATITSTSDFGYKVLLSMAEGVDISNLYLDGDTTSQYYIAPVEAESEEGVELIDNTWGFALGEDGGYSAIPLLDDAIIVAQGDEPVEDEALNIYYGVKVSSGLPAGTYSGGEVEYSLVSLEPTISDLSYMQDFAKLSESGKASVLRSMTEDEQYILKDSRDKKDYFIAKLKDGNVWMTQNLDLDLKTDGSIIYNSTNTNLTVAGNGAYENGYTVEEGIITWTPANATIDFTGSTVEGWSDSDMTPYSANPGDVYYYASGSDGNDIQYNSLADCVAANHTAEDCRHYHAGNYYNWSAAIASNDSSSLTIQYDNAANSICPAGWRLVTGRNSSGLYTGDFYDLFDSVGGILGERGPSYMGFVFYYMDNGFNNIRTNPIWLVRSGQIKEGSVSIASQYGYYWSNTFNRFEEHGGCTYAYQMGFGLNVVAPTSEAQSRTGYSLRCVAE